MAEPLRHIKCELRAFGNFAGDSRKNLADFIVGTADRNLNHFRGNSKNLEYPLLKDWPCGLLSHSRNQRNNAIRTFLRFEKLH